MATYGSLSTPTETLTPSELTSSSLISTTIRDEQNKFSNSGSAEVEIVVNLLNQARVQALASSDMENVSKRILDALIKSIINEFYTLPQERAKLHPLATKNAYVRFLCCLFVIAAVLLFSYRSRHTCSFTGLPPT